MTHKLLVLTVLYLIFPVLFGLGLSLAVRRLPDSSQPEVHKELWVFKDHPVTQVISPNHDGLNVLSVYLRNVALRNQDPFLFDLSDSTGVIRSIPLTGYNIGDGENVRFQFAPIPDSAGKSYVLKFSSSSPLSTAVGVGYSDSAASIAYQSFYRPTNRLSVLTSVSEKFLTSVFQPRFTLAFAVALLCLILLHKTILARFA